MVNYCFEKLMDTQIDILILFADQIEVPSSIFTSILFTKTESFDCHFGHLDWLGRQLVKKNPKFRSKQNMSVLCAHTCPRFLHWPYTEEEEKADVTVPPLSFWEQHFFKNVGCQNVFTSNMSAFWFLYAPAPPWGHVVLLRIFGYYHLFGPVFFTFESVFPGIFLVLKER